MQKLLLLLILPGFCFSQDKNEELIDWSASWQLSWSDYKAKPDPSSDAAASTTTYLSIEYNINEKGFSYKIQCRFSKTKSWGHAKTEFILKHEQGHFDIAEIYARTLNKKMSEYQFNKTTYQKDLKTIYGDITDEKEDFQNQYDSETNHSINKEKQAEWLEKIKTTLKELQAYSDY